MIKKSEFFKNKKSLIFLCVEFLLLLWGIAGLFGQRGILADTKESQALIEEGVALPAGVYTARIFYETRERGVSSFEVRAEGHEDVLRSTSVTLQPGISVQECQFYLLDKVDNLTIAALPDGDETLQIYGGEIEKGIQGSLIRIFWVLFVCLLINGAAVLFLYHRKHPFSYEKQLVLFGVPGAAIVSSVPLFVDYAVIGADLVFHLARIEAMVQSILSGDFFLRIEPYWMFGHGYASEIFYGNTLLLVPAFFRLIGFDLTASYNMFVFLVNLATAVIAYVSFQKCFQSPKIGLLGSVLYTLAPYRIYNIYNRAAVGEYTAMIFFPLLIWGFYEIFTGDIAEKKYKRNWLIPVIGFSGIIQSHVLSCEMAGVFVILLCLLLWKRVWRKQTFWVLAKTVIITAIVNAWFLVPFMDLFLADKYYMGNNAKVLIQNRGVLPAVILNTLQAAGASSRFAETGMLEAEPIGMGIALLVGTALWLAARLGRKINDSSSLLRFADPAFVLGCIALFMSTNLFPWDLLSKSSSAAAALVGALQFPTRITVIVTACMIFVCCVFGSWLFQTDVRPGAAKGVFTGLLLLSFLFGMYQTNDALDTKGSFLRIYSAQSLGTSAVLGAEYLPLGVAREHMSYHAPVADKGTVFTEYEKKGLKASLFVRTTEEGEHYVELPMLYYKGYHGKNTDTGEALQTVKGDNGDVRVILPKNFTGRISCSYDGMWYWHLATAVSIIACCGIAAMGAASGIAGRKR